MTKAKNEPNITSLTPKSGIVYMGVQSPMREWIGICSLRTQHNTWEIKDIYW
jgi:hypothetical protein